MFKDIIAIVCPDIHGRNFWKEVSKEYDGSVPFIFLGDYMDPYPDENITSHEAEKNFNEIWDFKQKWGDNVILILGNHDLSYFDDYFKTCRYDYNTKKWYADFLKNNLEHFKICHSIKNKDIKFLFSHAGVNPLWLINNGFEKILDDDYINSLFLSNRKSFNDMSFYRGGCDNAGSPIWADIREFIGEKSDTIKSIDKNVEQIVGHTQLIRDELKLDNITCIDSRQLFVVTNNNEIKKIKEI